jgi:hypothetical protein
VSQPITFCLISKAVHDPIALNELLEACKINKQCGHWSQFPCKCIPPCKYPTDDEIIELNKKIEEATKNVKTESFGMRGFKGTTEKGE